MKGEREGMNVETDIRKGINKVLAAVLKQSTRCYISVFLFASIFLLFLGTGTASAAPYTFEEHQITPSGYNTTPTLGADSAGPLVVFTSRLITQTGLGPGSIYYQRLKDGAPDGNTVLVSRNVTVGITDDELPDVSGGRIVYTSFDSQSVASGSIMLYDIATGTSTTVASVPSGGYIRGARIRGDKIAWVQGQAAAAVLMLYDVSQIGTDAPPTQLGGPTPTVGNIEIGDRFVVWDARPSGGFRDIYAYDLTSGAFYTIAADPNLDEWKPTTDGSWVVWEAQASGAASNRVLAKNLDTGELRVIADNGAMSHFPTISGNLITYESNVAGNYDIYLYRIQQGDTFQVTTDVADQHLNNIYGNMVAYVDARDGSYEVYVTSLKDRCGLSLPAPVLAYKGHHSYTVADPYDSYCYSLGNSCERFMLTVTNRLDYPADMFSSVGWDCETEVRVFPGDDPMWYIGSSCPDSPTALDDIGYDWRIIIGSCPLCSAPQKVFITLTDKICNTTYTSNMVTIYTSPVADAGPDQVITAVGSTVQLDGTQSYEEHGDFLMYLWYFAEKPAGSVALLSNPWSSQPTFVADKQGTYTIRLFVTDFFFGTSSSDDVVVSFLNVKPVANAGLSQSAVVGDTVTLNGSGSSDANGDPLTYQWSFTSVPAGSMAAIASPIAAITAFVPDLPGLFVAQLIVNDGFVNSDPSTVQVQAVVTQTMAYQATKNAQTAVASLNSSVLKNTNMQNALLNKLNAVLADISAGDYAAALAQLKNDILTKTDGCAKVGTLDQNDWIQTCDAQKVIYPYVVNLIQLVQGMK